MMYGFRSLLTLSVLLPLMLESRIAGAQTTYGTSSSSTSGPDSTKVYFTRWGNSMLVNAEINNRPMTMLFDTGASACVVGKNHLAQLGIKPPVGAPTGTTYGIGASGSVRMWTTRATIKVGQLVKNNCPILVQEELSGYPLLGQTFFGGYTYSIDAGANCITLRRNGVNTSTASAPSTQYVVPFVREGNEIVVTAYVNGRSCSMYVDTGAQLICFSQHDLQKLNVQIPGDAPVTLLSGIAGTTAARAITINRITLGPVDRSNVPVSVMDQSAISRPLLGQPFFEGWELQIDNAHHQIFFIRR